jgi:hypothetical protein
MFATQIIHDPETAVAKTLEQAILKLDAMNKMGHAQAKWGHNISNSCKDLPEEYHHDFIRYLANPGGYTQTSDLNQQIEEMILKDLPKEASTNIPDDLEQTYTITKKGDEYTILVENVNSDNDDDSHDEKTEN